MLVESTPGGVLCPAEALGVRLHHLSGCLGCAEEMPLCTLEGFFPKQRAVARSGQAWRQLLVLSREGVGSSGLAADLLTLCPCFRAHLCLLHQIPAASWLLHRAQPLGLPVPAAAVREA